MESVLQFSVLTWKNLYLQRLRQRPFVFVAEVLIATLPFVNIQNGKGRPGKEAFVNSIIYPVFTPDLQDIRVDELYYGPEVAYTNETVHRIREKLPNIKVVSLEDEDAVTNAVYSQNRSGYALGLYFRSASRRDEVVAESEYAVTFSPGVFHIREREKRKEKNGPSEVQDGVYFGTFAN